MFQVSLHMPATSAAQMEIHVHFTCLQTLAQHYILQARRNLGVKEVATSSPWWPPGEVDPAGTPQQPQQGVRATLVRLEVDWRTVKAGDLPQQALEEQHASAATPVLTGADAPRLVAPTVPADARFILLPQRSLRAADASPEIRVDVLDGGIWDVPARMQGM